MKIPYTTVVPHGERLPISKAARVEFVKAWNEAGDNAILELAARKWELRCGGEYVQFSPKMIWWIAMRQNLRPVPGIAWPWKPPACLTDDEFFLWYLHHPVRCWNVVVEERNNWIHYQDPMHGLGPEYAEDFEELRYRFGLEDEPACDARSEGGENGGIGHVSLLAGQGTLFDDEVA